MKFSVIEILASILIILASIKLLVIAVNVRAWVSFAKRFYAHSHLTSLISVALAGLVLYLLLQSGLTIVQILAVNLFVVLLIVAGVAPYSSRIIAWFETEDLMHVIKRQWLHIVIWLLLLGWGVYEILKHN